MEKMVVWLEGKCEGILVRSKCFFLEPTKIIFPQFREKMREERGR